MTDLVAIARKRDDRIKTHWKGCEEQHTECLIHKMADEIERLRNVNIRLRALLREPLDSKSQFPDWFIKRLRKALDDE